MAIPQVLVIDELGQTDRGREDCWLILTGGGAEVRVLNQTWSTMLMAKC
jgi:hypothetical protein